MSDESEEKVSAALERLEGLLADKDEELSEANATIERLENELEGSREGWRLTLMIDDDGELPVPRLEMVYTYLYEDWRNYQVVYQLVFKHLLGKLMIVPLSRTTVQGGDGEPPDNVLPFRDGAHARHDSGHLDMPVYKIVLGEKPVLIETEGTHHHTMGVGHRRP